MARILAFPFALTGSGAIATVEQASDDANAQQLAVLLLTRAGERPMVPSFGLTDPAFAGIEPGEVAAGIARFGPPVRLAAIDAAPVDDATVAVEVRFV